MAEIIGNIYKISDSLFIEPVSSEVIKIVKITHEQSDCIIEITEYDARELINGIKAYLSCEHKWITIPDFDNGTFWSTPVKIVCEFCGSEQPI